MKKIGLVICIMVFSTAIFAQKISGGLFVGPNISWFGTDSKHVNNEGIRLGYTFGAMIDYNMLDNFVLSTGIKYNNVGGNLKYKYGVKDFTRADLGDTTVMVSTNMKYKLDYIEIPIGFKGKTNEIGYMTYFLKAGITPGINIKGKADVAVNSDDVISKELRLFTMGWHIGGGVEYALSGSTRLIVELVYTGYIFDFDESDVFSQPYIGGTTDTTNPTIGVNNLMIVFGILF